MERVMNDEESNESRDGISEESELRGAEHSARKRNPDRELHLDGESDTLYDDGLEIDTGSETLAGTDGSGPKGIKG